MYYPKFIVSSQKEESISIQSVKVLEAHSVAFEISEIIYQNKTDDGY